MSITKPINECDDNLLPFNPCHTPRGMQWYDLLILTPNQQRELNELKVIAVREDNKYLAKHPEIRAIISIFLRAVLKHRSLLVSPAEFAALFFAQPKERLQDCIDEYLSDRGEPLDKEGNSALDVRIPHKSKSTSSIESASQYYSYETLTDKPIFEYMRDWYSDVEGESDHSVHSTFKTFDYLDNLQRYGGESSSGSGAYSMGMDFDFAQLSMIHAAQYGLDYYEDELTYVIRGILDDTLQNVAKYIDEERLGEGYFDQEILEVEKIVALNEEDVVELPVGEDQLPTLEEANVLFTLDKDLIDESISELNEATEMIVKSILSTSDSQ